MFRKWGGGARGILSRAKIPSWLNPLTIVIVASIVVAGTLGIGWAVAAQNANAWAERASSLQERLTDREAQLQSVTDDRDTYKDVADAARDRQADLDAKQSDLDDKLASADAQQKQLDERQKQVAASELSDGVHRVGTDTQAGVYSITDSSDCYYAWMSGTGSDANIVDNNIVSGPATVTLKAGETFETNGCGSWTKVG